MSLRERFNRLFGGKKKAMPDLGAKLPASSDCPHEADVVAYLQNALRSRERRRLESHFAGCDDCRESLTLFVRLSDNQADDFALASAPLTEEAIRQQTAKVLSMIENDDRVRERSIAARHAWQQTNRRGFYLSYPKLAAVVLVFCAAAAGAVFWLTSGPSAEESAVHALQAAMRDERRTITRISGNFAHSEWANGTRGESTSDDFQLERALTKMKHAEKASASVVSRHILASVHLAFGRPNNARQALAILEQLLASGHQSAEIFNDLGVAQFQLGEYDRAIESFSSALAISPKYGEALFNRALAYERKSRSDEARRDWQNFISVSSDDQWKVEAERRLKSHQHSLGK